MSIEMCYGTVFTLTTNLVDSTLPHADLCISLRLISSRCCEGSTPIARFATCKGQRESMYHVLLRQSDDEKSVEARSFNGKRERDRHSLSTIAA
eukprot:3512524-Amphidinium_carterae.1